MGQKGKKIQSKSRKNSLWLVMGGAAIMIGIVWFAMRTTNSNAVKMPSGPLALIATMSPDLYSGKARGAYQAAKDIPEILAQLPCFCGCMENIGHKNTLYCFKDDHGAECDLCQSIALDAQEMHRKGVGIQQIRDNIRTAYAHIQ